MCIMVNCKNIIEAHENIAKFKLNIDKEIHKLCMDDIKNGDELDNWNNLLCDIVMIIDKCIVNRVYCGYDIDLERDKQPFESWDNKQYIGSCVGLCNMIDNVCGVYDFDYRINYTDRIRFDKEGKCVFDKYGFGLINVESTEDIEGVYLTRYCFEIYRSIIDNNDDDDECYGIDKGKLTVVIHDYYERGEWEVDRIVFQCNNNKEEGLLYDIQQKLKEYVDNYQYDYQYNYILIREIVN